MKLGHCILLLLLLCACRKAAEPAPLQVRVLEVTVQDQTPAELELSVAGALDPAELRAAAVEGLRQAGIEVAPADPVPAARPAGDYRLRLELRLDHVAPSADTENRGVLRAATRGRLQALRAAPGEADESAISRFDQDALAEKIYTGAAPGRPAWAAHARRAVRDTAEGLGRQLRLVQARRAELLALLGKGDADQDLRGVAIALLGQRRDRQAVDPLIALLRDPDGEIRDKAIGALIEIGDRRAVKALAASAQFQDTYELGKILEAIASLGGEEARSYLGFVAAGHQNETIRGEAKTALSHLEQREQRQRKK